MSTEGVGGGGVVNWQLREKRVKSQTVFVVMFPLLPSKLQDPVFFSADKRTSLVLHGHNPVSLILSLSGRIHCF